MFAANALDVLHQPQHTSHLTTSASKPRLMSEIWRAGQLRAVARSVCAQSRSAPHKKRPSPFGDRAQELGQVKPPDQLAASGVPNLIAPQILPAGQSSFIKQHPPPWTFALHHRQSLTYSQSRALTHGLYTASQASPVAHYCRHRHQHLCEDRPRKCPISSPSHKHRGRHFAVPDHRHSSRSGDYCTCNKG